MADGKALRPVRADRLGLVLHLAEHQFSLGSTTPKRDKKIPVKPPDVSFHRCGQDKIEPDNPGAALDDGVDDAGKLAGPHDLGDIAKRRAAVGFFVDGNDNDRRILGCMHRPKGFVPKPEQAIER